MTDAETRLREEVLAFVHTIAAGFDCDADAHRYSTFCRACAAEKLEAKLIVLPSLAPGGETPCGRCGGPCRYETGVSNEQWNRVIRHGGPEQTGEYLCAACVLETFVLAGDSFKAQLSGGAVSGGEIEVRVVSVPESVGRWCEPITNQDARTSFWPPEPAPEPTRHMHAIVNPAQSRNVELRCGARFVESRDEFNGTLQESSVTCPNCLAILRPGPTPGRDERALCKHCGGNGTVKIHHGVSYCPRCHGDCWEPQNLVPPTPQPSEAVTVEQGTRDCSDCFEDGYAEGFEDGYKQGRNAERRVSVREGAGD